MTVRKNIEDTNFSHPRGFLRRSLRNAGAGFLMGALLGLGSAIGSLQAFSKEKGTFKIFVVIMVVTVAIAGGVLGFTATRPPLSEKKSVGYAWVLCLVLANAIASLLAVRLLIFFLSCMTWELKEGNRALVWIVGLTMPFICACWQISHIVEKRPENGSNPNRLAE